MCVCGYIIGWYDMIFFLIENCVVKWCYFMYLFLKKRLNIENNNKMKYYENIN